MRRNVHKMLLTLVDIMERQSCLMVRNKNIWFIIVIISSSLIMRKIHYMLDQVLYIVNILIIWWVNIFILW